MHAYIQVFQNVSQIVDRSAGSRLPLLTSRCVLSIHVCEACTGSTCLFVIVRILYTHVAAAQFFCFSEFSEAEVGSGSCGGNFIGMADDAEGCCLPVRSASPNGMGARGYTVSGAEECTSCMTVTGKLH